MAKPSSLATLTARGREIVAYVMNTVAFKTHGDEAELTTMAKNLGTTPGRLLPTLRKLASAGWLSIEERSLTFVYPTAAAIRAHGKLSEKQAQAILNRLRKSSPKRERGE